MAIALGGCGETNRHDGLYVSLSLGGPWEFQLWRSDEGQTYLRSAHIHPIVRMACGGPHCPGDTPIELVSIVRDHVWFDRETGRRIRFASDHALSQRLFRDGRAPLPRLVEHALEHAKHTPKPAWAKRADSGV